MRVQSQQCLVLKYELSGPQLRLRPSAGHRGPAPELRPGGEAVSKWLGVGTGYNIRVVAVAVGPRPTWRMEEGHLQTESRAGGEGLGLSLACDRENSV